MAWQRSLFDWEKDQVRQLLEVVHDSCPALEKADRWVWKDVKVKEFSVKSGYEILRGVSEGDCSRMFKMFWRIKALPLAYVTAWMVLENKIVTKVNLFRRGIAIRSVLYCFCGLKEKELNHLFFSVK